MKRELGKYIESDSEKGGGEPRFVGTRIAVAAALEYVALGKSFQWISDNYNNFFPPEAVAEAVELSAKLLSDKRMGKVIRVGEESITILADW